MQSYFVFYFYYVTSKLKSYANFLLIFWNIFFCVCICLYMYKYNL